MPRQLIFLSVLFIGSALCAIPRAFITDIKKIERAIEQINIKVVEDTLKEMIPLAQPDKKRLLATAEKWVEYRKVPLGQGDKAMIISGLMMLSIGLAPFFVLSWRDYISEPVLLTVIAYLQTFTILGYGAVMHGWNSQGLGSIETKARKILDLIKKAPAEGDPIVEEAQKNLSGAQAAKKDLVEKIPAQTPNPTNKGKP